MTEPKEGYVKSRKFRFLKETGVNRIRETFGNSGNGAASGRTFSFRRVPLGSLIKGTRNRRRCLASGNTKTTGIRKKKKKRGKRESTIISTAFLLVL